MKTKKIELLGGAMLGLFICALGCSDGELPSQAEAAPGGALVAPPTCNNFTASPEVVQAGGQATLAWEVEGADQVEIAASGVETKFSYSTTSEFSASTVVADIQETTIFVLTATKLPTPEGETEGGGEAPAGGMVVKEDQPAGGTEEGTAPAEPQTCRMTTKVTVEGAAQALSIGQFYAEALEVDAGDKTVLHWEVTPADAEVSLASSTGEQPIVGDCNAETTDDLELEGEVSEVLPASGCASIQPMEDTIYTLTASAGGETTSQDLAITVVKAPRIDSFLANGSASLKVSAYPTAVTLAWKIKPSIAKVTIASSGGVEEPLPQGLTQTEGEISVMVRQDTTFTLTASVEGQSDAVAQVAVTSDLSGLDCATQFLVAGPTTPVFEGEKVRLSWSLPPQVSAQTSVQVTSGAEEVLATADGSSGAVEVPARVEGYNVRLSVQGVELCSASVSLTTVNLKNISSDRAVRVVPDPANAAGAYAGLNLNTFNGGKIKVVHYQPEPKVMEIDFFKALKDYDKLTGTLTPQAVEKFVQTFPVNAIAIDSKGTLYVATTGVILYKKSDGDAAGGNWKALTSLLRVDNKGDYPGEHPTCFGKMQSGKKTQIKGEIVTMGQVCDMVATEDGKLYAATDRGLYYLNDAQAYIAGAKDQKWVGRKSALYGKVVNDVLVDGSKIYAAGAMGVAVSEDGGANWMPLLEGVEAYSVASADDLLVVGVEGGLKVKRADGDWEDKTLMSDNGIAVVRVYSVAVDRGVVYAGTDAGLFVSRDGAQTFMDAMSSQGDSARPVVRSIAVGAGEGFNFYMATESGVMNAAPGQ